jgi:hypothetical protein
MLSIIVVQTTLISIAIIYLLYRCRDLPNTKKSTNQVDEFRQGEKQGTEEDPFNNMSEEILLAFLEYKRSKVKK